MDTALLSLVLEVDRAFTDYSIQLKPAEARSFFQLSSDDAVSQLINEIDQSIPQAMGRRYFFSIGREAGKRFLKLTLSKPTFPKFDFSRFANQLRLLAPAEALMEMTGDELEWATIFLWTGEPR